MSVINISDFNRNYEPARVNLRPFEVRAVRYAYSNIATKGKHYRIDAKKKLFTESDITVLTNTWVSDTQFSSSLDDIFDHHAYKAIISMGWKAVPYIIADLRDTPKPWFHALRMITGQDVIRDDDAGNFSAMRSAWLAWAEQNGF